MSEQIQHNFSLKKHIKTVSRYNIHTFYVLYLKCMYTQVTYKFKKPEKLERKNILEIIHIYFAPYNNIADTKDLWYSYLENSGLILENEMFSTN